jgi:hypothetical protein
MNAKQNPRPQVTADTLNNYALRFEADDCSRCAGSGFYATGTCFKCSGRKTVLTRNGAKARERFEAKRDELMGTPVEDLLPGDVVYTRFGYTKGMADLPMKWREVTVVSHEIESHGFQAVVNEPRPRAEHPEDWKALPAQVHLYAAPAKKEYDGLNRFTIGEPRGQAPFQRGNRVPVYNRDAMVQAVNAALKLKGAYLVDKETGEEFGRPTEAEKAEQERKNAQRRARNAQKREEQKTDALTTFLGEHDTAKKVHEFASDANTYPARTLRDLRNFLISRGFLSEKQLSFAANLLDEHFDAQETVN